MPSISLKIPEELEPLVDDLEFFLRTMVKKLYMNRHKGFADGCDADGLLQGVDSEVEELKMACAQQGQFEAIVEACDVANMGFFVALLVGRMTKEDFKAMQRKYRDDK